MSDPTPHRAAAKLFGALLMAVGAMIAGLCGLCSAAVLVSLANSDPGGIGGMVIAVMIFGGAPIAVGVALFLWGRSLWRGPNPGRGAPR